MILHSWVLDCMSLRSHAIWTCLVVASCSTNSTMILILMSLLLLSRSVWHLTQLVQMAGGIRTTTHGYSSSAVTSSPSYSNTHVTSPVLIGYCLSTNRTKPTKSSGLQRSNWAIACSTMRALLPSECFTQSPTDYGS